MLRRSFGVILTLLLAIPSPPAKAQQPTETTPSSEGATGMAHAKDLYVQRRYIEAARAFEAMDTAGAAYNSGMARAAAGHQAHALLRWAKYLELAKDLTAAERADIVRSMGDARRRTSAVTFFAVVAPETRTLVIQIPNSLAEDALHVPWPAGKSSTIVYLDVGTWSAALRTANETAPDQQLVVRAERAALNVYLGASQSTSTVTLRVGPKRALKRGLDVSWNGPGETEERRFVPADTRWALRPGSWRLGARARGYEPVERAVTVTEGPTQVDLTLRRDRNEQARIGLGVGLGLAGAGLLTSGGILFAAGKKYNPTAAAVLDGVPNPSTEASIDAVERGLRRQSGGIALLSAGAGATVVALTAGLGGAKPALATEAGLGALSLAGGIAWLAHAQGCPYRLAETLDKPFSQYAPRYDALRECGIKGVPGAMLLGAGAGLLGGAIVTLATQGALRRRASRLRASASLSSTNWAVSIQGRF